MKSSELTPSQRQEIKDHYQYLRQQWLESECVDWSLDSNGKVVKKRTYSQLTAGRQDGIRAAMDDMRIRFGDWVAR